jgi:hypothetical protein
MALLNAPSVRPKMRSLAGFRYGELTALAGIFTKSYRKSKGCNKKHYKLLLKR